MQIIDMHCHVLPTIDDGSRSTKMSCEMLNLFQQQGGVAVIATPHGSMKFNSPPEVIRGLCRKLERRFEGRSGKAVQIFPGQEIFYRESIFELLNEGKLLTMADSVYVLVEFLPSAAWSEIRHAARQFAGSGYRMILAHAERYTCLRKEERVEELLRLGVYIQLTVRSISGKWFGRTALWCRKLLKERYVHFISSDMHNVRERKPEYAKALEWMKENLDKEYIEEICWKNAVCMIKNQKI